MDATSGIFSFGNLNGQPLRMGYCPQMDALDSFLTVQETLHIYAKLRGIAKETIAEVKLVQSSVSLEDRDSRYETNPEILWLFI